MSCIKTFHFLKLKMQFILNRSDYGGIGMAVILVNKFVLKVGELIIASAQVQEAGELIALTKQIDTETDFLMRDPGEFNIDLKNEEKLINSKRNSESECLLVAKVNGEMVGTLRFSSNRYSRYKHKGQFVISVKKAFWGYGIGGKLIETMLAWADAYGFLKIKLEVDANNDRAIALYKKMGFEQEGLLRMDKYVGNEIFIDSIVMGRINNSKSK